MTISEHQKQDYFRKSGDTFITNGRIESNEQGFCVWDFDAHRIILMQVYGDGEYWDEWSERKARELGLKKIFIATKRNPGAFVRKYNYKLIGHVLEKDL